MPPITNATLQLFTEKARCLSLFRRFQLLPTEPRLAQQYHTPGGDRYVLVETEELHPNEPDITVTLVFASGLRMGQLWDLVQQTQSKMTGIQWPVIFGDQTPYSPREPSGSTTGRIWATTNDPLTLRIRSYRAPLAGLLQKVARIMSFPVYLWYKCWRLFLSTTFYKSERSRGLQAYDRYITKVSIKEKDFTVQDEDFIGLKMWKKVVRNFMEAAFEE
ncbi:hypothetical protein F4810DRAFT_715576 [Camillea tinctor]|nr:hypothetical protein F4810DRAFT_715576 [Camillea tinctor]